MADITFKKRSGIITLSKHWNYTQRATENCKRYTKNNTFSFTEGFDACRRSPKLK